MSSADARLLYNDWCKWNSRRVDPTTTSESFASWLRENLARITAACGPAPEREPDWKERSADAGWGHGVDCDPAPERAPQTEDVFHDAHGDPWPKEDAPEGCDLCDGDGECPFCYATGGNSNGDLCPECGGTSKCPQCHPPEREPDPNPPPEPEPPRCSKCGYSEEDAQFHMDHHLCDGEIPPNPERSPQTEDVFHDAHGDPWPKEDAPAPERCDPVVKIMELATKLPTKDLRAVGEWAVEHAKMLERRPCFTDESNEALARAETAERELHETKDAHASCHDLLEDAEQENVELGSQVDQKDTAIDRLVQDLKDLREDCDETFEKLSDAERENAELKKLIKMRSKQVDDGVAHIEELEQEDAELEARVARLGCSEPDGTLRCSVHDNPCEKCQSNQENRDRIAELRAARDRSHKRYQEANYRANRLAQENAELRKQEDAHRGRLANVTYWKMEHDRLEQENAELEAARDRSHKRYQEANYRANRLAQENAELRERLAAIDRGVYPPGVFSKLVMSKAGEAEAMALVMSHEGHIAKLAQENAELKKQEDAHRGRLENVTYWRTKHDQLEKAIRDYANMVGWPDRTIVAIAMLTDAIGLESDGGVDG